MTSPTPEKPGVDDTGPVYDNESPKHVHAIGVIALTYAKLQVAMDDLLLTRTQSGWAEKYYQGLSEDKRSDAIREAFKDDDPGVVDAIGNLVKYFDWYNRHTPAAEIYPEAMRRAPKIRADVN
jgi:hypothetical protein